MNDIKSVTELQGLYEKFKIAQNVQKKRELEKRKKNKEKDEDIGYGRRTGRKIYDDDKEEKNIQSSIFTVSPSYNSGSSSSSSFSSSVSSFPFPTVSHIPYSNVWFHYNDDKVTKEFSAPWIFPGEKQNLRCSNSPNAIILPPLPRNKSRSPPQIRRSPSSNQFHNNQINTHTNLNYPQFCHRSFFGGYLPRNEVDINLLQMYDNAINQPEAPGSVCS
jgi:hypothetical protein